MLKIELKDGTIVESKKGEDIRSSLKKHFDQVYHPSFRYLNCKGFGTCGTCTFEVKGEVTPPTKMEKWRLNFPPHKNSLEKGLRLICQCEPLSDVKLIKHEGRWGQNKKD